MADEDKRSQSPDENPLRFNYIGFDVFPGKPGNIFESDDERKSLIKKVMDKFSRSDGEVRDRCTLLEERISVFEKWFLGFLAVIMLVAIFLPWFSGYYEIVTTSEVPVAMVSEAPADSLALVEEGSSAEALAGDTAEVSEAEPTEEAASDTVEERLAAVGDSAQAGDSAAVAGVLAGINGEAIKVTETSYDYRTKTGIGALFSLGSYGSMLFSSGFVLIITSILMILYFLCCVGLAGFNLYVLFGVKKSSADEYALFLKEKLRYNWVPVYVWLAMFFLAFIGGSYGFDSGNMLEQVGDIYGVSTFIGLSSYGIYLSLSAFLIMALKGKEI